MEKYFYKPLHLSFKEEEMRENRIDTDGVLDYSTLFYGSTYASIKDMLDDFEEKGYARRPLFVKGTGEELGDVLFYRHKKRPLLGVYRFHVDDPSPVQYIVEEEIRNVEDGTMRIRWTEPMSDVYDARERAFRINQSNKWLSSFDSDVRVIKANIREEDFEKALPFPHNVGMYMES